MSYFCFWEFSECFILPPQANPFSPFMFSSTCNAQIIVYCGFEIPSMVLLMAESTSLGGRGALFLRILFLFLSFSTIFRRTVVSRTFSPPEAIEVLHHSFLFFFRAKKELCLRRALSLIILLFLFGDSRVRLPQIRILSSLEP